MADRRVSKPPRSLGLILAPPPKDHDQQTSGELLKYLFKAGRWTHQAVAEAIGAHEKNEGKGCSERAVKTWLYENKIPSAKNSEPLIDFIETRCAEDVNPQDWIQALANSWYPKNDYDSESLLVDKKIGISSTHEMTGNLENIFINWEALTSSGRFDKIEPEEREKIDDWMSKGTPPLIVDVLEICAALDVDLISILHFNKGGLLKELGDFWGLLQKNRIKYSALRPLWEMFYPSPDWPSNSLVETYYDRSWFNKEFEHTAKHFVNHYALIKISTLDISKTHPVAFHFAFRNNSEAYSSWKPYGSIFRLHDKVNLIYISGDFQTKKFEKTDDVLQVETFFGGDPAEFRISSLHKFQIKVEYPSSASDALRFGK